MTPACAERWSALAVSEALRALDASRRVTGRFSCEAPMIADADWRALMAGARRGRVPAARIGAMPPVFVLDARGIL